MDVIAKVFCSHKVEPRVTSPLMAVAKTYTCVNGEIFIYWRYNSFHSRINFHCFKAYVLKLICTPTDAIKANDPYTSSYIMGVDITQYFSFISANNQYIKLTNPIMHQSNIPQCILQNKCVQISVLNSTLWDVEQVHCGIVRLIYYPNPLVINAMLSSCAIKILTLNVRGPSYLGLTRSISWLLMPWLLTSPGHQQPWYWLCRICKSLSYLRKDFKYLCHINVE